MNKHMSDAHWLQSPEVVGRIKPRAKLNKVKQALNTKARKASEKSAGKSKLCWEARADREEEHFSRKAWRM